MSEAPLAPSELAELAAIAQLPSELELAQFLLAVSDGLSPGGRKLARRICAAASSARIAAKLFETHGEWLANMSKAYTAQYPEGADSKYIDAHRALESTLAAFRKEAE